MSVDSAVRVREARGSTSPVAMPSKRRTWHGWTPLLWLTPAIALIGLVHIYPSIRALQLSLTSSTTFDPGVFIGVKNYATLADSSLFWQSVGNNLLLLMSVPLSIVIALLVTGVLYRGVVGRSLYEAAIFIPFLPAVASVGVIFIYILSPHGPFNATLETVGLDAFTAAWLSAPWTARLSIFAIMTWKRVGLIVLFFLARLTSIDQNTLEAAAVDGASWPQAFLRIAIPQMRAIIGFAAVLGLIEVFAWTFAFVFVLTRGGPSRATFTLDFLIYDFQFTQQALALASTAAIVLLVIALSVGALRVWLQLRDY